MLGNPLWPDNQNKTKTVTVYTVSGIMEPIDTRGRTMEQPTSTSISSLNFRRGASRILRKVKSSLSIGISVIVSSAILCQWRGFIALLAISSSRGTISLKSSIFFFSSSAAGQSFRAFGSFRNLKETHERMRIINQ